MSVTMPLGSTIWRTRPALSYCVNCVTWPAALVTDCRSPAVWPVSLMSIETGPWGKAAAGGVKSPQLAANWVAGEMSALLNDRDLDFSTSPLDAAAFAGLLARIEDGTVSAKAAKEVLQAMADGAGDADTVIEMKGLRQISDTGELAAAIDAVLAANAKQVEDYRAGKEKAFNSLVGQVMKATKGKANPQEASRLLREKLAG